MINEIKNYLNLNNDILFAYLFGSYAKNNFTQISDVDIAIYLKNDTDIFDKKLRIHLDLSKLLNKEIDLIILNETKSYSLLKDILDNHILLKDSPDDSREMFEVTKHHDILDFQVFQRMIDVA